MKYEKIKIFTLILVFYGLNIQAQFTDDIPKNRPFFDKKKVSWGYYFGMNFYDFKVAFDQPYEHMYVESNPGFQVGMVGNINLGRSFSIRTTPGIYFTNRKLIFRNLTTPRDSIRDLTSNYVQIPISLKFNTIRYGNIRPYITGGIVYAYNINSWEDSKNDNSAGHFRMRSNVFMYEIGFGLEMYLFYFKFTPSIKGIFSLQDEMIPDIDPNSPWTNHIESVKTRGVFINLTFE